MVDQVRAEEAIAKQDGQSLYKNATEITEIREADYVVKSAIHPDTGKINIVPMRMCSFLPANMPIVVGMLLTSPTMKNTVFW
jgi:hypothetical protein